MTILKTHELFSSSDKKGNSNTENESNLILEDLDLKRTKLGSKKVRLTNMLLALMYFISQHSDLVLILDTHISALLEHNVKRNKLITEKIIVLLIHSCRLNRML